MPSLMFSTVGHSVAAHCSSGVHATNQWSTVCCCCRPVNTGQTCTPVLPSLSALSCQPHGPGIQPDGASWLTPGTPFCSLSLTFLCHPPHQHSLPQASCLPLPPPATSLLLHLPPSRPLACLPSLPVPLARRPALLYPPHTHLRDPTWGLPTLLILHRCSRPSSPQLAQPATPAAAGHPQTVPGHPWLVVVTFDRPLAPPARTSNNSTQKTSKCNAPVGLQAGLPACPIHVLGVLFNYSLSYL